MKPNCQMDYTEADTGETVICIAGQNGQSPNPGHKKIGGKWACKECYKAIEEEIRRRSGVGKFNAYQAIKRSNL